MFKSNFNTTLNYACDAGILLWEMNLSLRNIMAPIYSQLCQLLRTYKQHSIVGALVHRLKSLFPSMLMFTIPLTQIKCHQLVTSGLKYETKPLK